MKIEILVCRPDGTQVLEQREVPDDWFNTGEEVQEPEDSKTEE